MARTVSAPNAVSKLIGVNIDITEDYQRAQELETSRLEAEQANLAKSNFLANMSHELRTPLNAVIGFSETMSLQALGPLPAVYREYANHIHFSARHLLDMIEQLLDLSRIESGQMELSVDEVPLDALAKEVVQIIASANDRPLADFMMDTESLDVTLRADARVLRQTLINVVGNAAKFSDAGSSIVIEGSLSAESIEIRVRDRGIGIAASDIDAVFEPYNRSSSESALTRNGTGLGLPIARALAEAHGGSLDLASEVNVGSVVTIKLPRERVVYPRVVACQRSAG
jgi:signal transduction histidine kinase